jgi:hypothetical protein
LEDFIIILVALKEYLMKKLKIITVILLVVYTIVVRAVSYKFYIKLFSIGSGVSLSSITYLIPTALWLIIDIIILGLGICFLAMPDLERKDNAYKLLRFIFVIQALLLLPETIYFTNVSAPYAYNQSLWTFGVFILFRAAWLFFFIVLLVCTPEKRIKKTDLTEYQLVAYASTWHRFVHYIVDILFLLPVVLGYIQLWNQELRHELPGYSLQLIIFVVWFFYYFLSEAIFHQTLGKMATKSCVVSNGIHLSTGRILLRTLCRLIPFNAWSFLFRANWHDTVSSTAVVYVDTWEKVFENEQPTIDEPAVQNA